MKSNGMRVASTAVNKRTGGTQITVVQNGRSMTLHLDRNGRDRYGRRWNVLTGTFEVPYVDLDAVDPRQVTDSALEDVVQDVLADDFFGELNDDPAA
jgi:hypothetical protein